VNWRTCQSPRRLGGLGIKNLEKFNIALRLWWHWLNWDSQDSNEKGCLGFMIVLIGLFFFASTYVHIGDGKGTLF
jgi:hypothetical protein